MIRPEIGHHPVDLPPAEPDLPAELDDILDVLVESLLELLPLVGVEPLGGELLLDDIILAIQRRHLVQELDDPIQVHVLFDNAVLVLDIVQQALHPDRPALQLGAHTDDVLDGGGDAEDGFHALLGALFDLLGDLDLALPAEQRNQAHFPQVHLHRIAGLADRGQEPEDILALAVDPLVRRLLDDQLFPFVRIDDIDILLAEEHDDIINLIRGDDVGGEQIIHVVIGQKSLFLTKRDQLLEFIGFYFFCHIGFSR